MATTTQLCEVLWTFVCICAFQTFIVDGTGEDVKLLSGEQLGDIDVYEGEDVTLNCTVTGRPDINYRIQWYIVWTSGDDSVSPITIFAEESKDYEITESGHGNFKLEYSRIENEDDDESTAINMCLLKINQIKVMDTGTYRCIYYHVDLGMDVNLAGGLSTLSVETGVRPPTMMTTPTPAATTVTPGVGVRGGSSSGAATGAITGVLVFVIALLVSIWAVFRFKRYRRDKRGNKIQLPTDLIKVESDRNSYGDVLVNGTTAVNEHNHENPVITDDVPGVRLPPQMLSQQSEPDSYSVLNRPDSVIRNHLGEATYSTPPDATDSSVYVVVPDPINPSAPSSSIRSTTSRDARDRTSYEVYETPLQPPNPTLPRRTSSTYPAIPERASSERNGVTNYMEENDLAYLADMSTVYDDVPSPDVQL